MLHLEKLVFNSFQVNTYVVHDESGECLIIDPACYSDEENMTLKNFIDQRKLKPVLHINTHCHIDHVLGMQFVRDTYSIPSYGHEKESQNLISGPLMGDLFGFSVNPLPPIDRNINDNETISFGNSELLALHVPGHSPGSLAFYSSEGKFVITGDALFDGSIGRTDLPGGNYDTLIDSIRSKLFTLPPETTVWPGHGSSSTIGKEISENPFFNDYKT